MDRVEALNQEKGIPPTIYKYIIAWGKFRASFDYYIRDSITQAEKDNAPETAIFKAGAIWQTYEDITNPEAIKFIDDFLHSLE